MRAPTVAVLLAWSLLGLSGCALDRAGLGDGDGQASLDAALGPDAEPGDGGVPADGEPPPGDSGSDPHDAGRSPVLSSIEPATLAHGGRARLRGAGLSSVTGVRIGGVAQAFVVNDDASIELTSIPDATPVGAQPIDLEGPTPVSAALTATVVHLVIDELDEETDGGADIHQFVEIGTSVPGASLTGYTLVLFGGTADTAHLVYPLTTADPSGRLLIGNAALAPPPAIVLADDSLGRDGVDALAIYQGTFEVGSPVSTADLVDAVVYSRAGTVDPGLAPLVVAGTVADESIGTGGERNDSLQRCARARRDVTAFRPQGPPSPGAMNLCD